MKNIKARIPEGRAVLVQEVNTVPGVPGERGSHMTNSTIDNLLDSCDRLQRYTVPGEGLMHSSVRCFNACMRAFDRKGLTPESITFRVYFKAPVNAYGYATIHRDGTIGMWTSDIVE